MLIGAPTQDEIMAISLFKLGLRSGDTFADVGCGSGKVAIAASRFCSKVFAIDRRSEAVEYTRAELEKGAIKNVDLIEGDALEALDRIGPLDCAFVGGSKNLSETLTKLSGSVRRSIVVNAVLLRTLSTAVAKMRELGIFQEAVLVQAARSKDLAGDMMFKPIDPVYIVVGRVDGKC